MSDIAKIILFVFAIIYIVSPIDLFNGPIDDMLILLLVVATINAKRIVTNSDAE